MLALRIIATTFIGLSCITTVLKTMAIYEEEPEKIVLFTFTIYSWLWRALVIVTLWII